MTRRPDPPSGHPPPRQAKLANGEILELEPLAARICERYREEFPDEEQRYGDAGMAWCRHDNQHILGWSALAARGYLDMWAKVEWLARILAARDFPLPRLARNLAIAAEVITEERPEDGEVLARELRTCAGRVQGLPGCGPQS